MESKFYQVTKDNINDIDSMVRDIQKIMKSINKTYKRCGYIDRDNHLEFKPSDNSIEAVIGGLSCLISLSKETIDIIERYKNGEFDNEDEEPVEIVPPIEEESIQNN